MKQVIALAALAAVWPVTSANAADCPGADALDTTGIRIDYADDWHIHAKRAEDGTIYEVTYDGSGDPYWVNLWLGLYVVRDGYLGQDGVVADETRDYVYDRPIADLAIPTKPGAENFAVTETFSLGGDSNTARLSINTGTAIQYRIAGCTYPAVPIVTNYTPDGEDGVSLQLWYLTEVGLAVLTAVGEPGKIFDEFYTPAKISAAGP